MRCNRCDLGARWRRMHPSAVLAAARVSGNQLLITSRMISIPSFAMLRKVMLFASFVEQASINVCRNIRMFTLGLAPLGALHYALQEPGHLVVLPVVDQEVVRIVGHWHADMREAWKRRYGSPWMNWRRYAGLQRQKR